MITPMARHLLVAADPYGLESCTCLDGLGQADEWEEVEDFGDESPDYGDFKDDEGWGDEPDPSKDDDDDWVQDLEDLDDDIQEGMKTVQQVQQKAEQYGKALKGFIEFFKFGADPIVAPHFGLGADGTPMAGQVCKAKTRQEFINLSGQGCIFRTMAGGAWGPPDAGSYLHWGFKLPVYPKPPYKKGQPRNIWNPLAGIWQADPFQATDQYIKNLDEGKTKTVPTKHIEGTAQVGGDTYKSPDVKISPETLRVALRAYLPSNIDRAVTWATEYIGKKDYARAVKYPGFGLDSMLEQLTHPAARWNVAENKIVEFPTVDKKPNPYYNKPFQVLYADGLRKTLELIAKIPSNQRPAKTGEVALLASDLEKKGFNTGYSKLAGQLGATAGRAGAGGGAAMLLVLAALVFFMMGRR